MNEDRLHHPPVDPVKAGLGCRCPHCGQGALFDGFLALKPGCAACGLDYGFADAGDGPAVFVMLIAGFVVIGLALWFDSLFSPPVWLQALLWVPFALILCLFLLRRFKGLMIAWQYRQKAGEGGIEHG